MPSARSVSKLLRAIARASFATALLAPPALACARRQLSVFEPPPVFLHVVPSQGPIESAGAAPIVPHGEPDERFPLVSRGPKLEPIAPVAPIGPRLREAYDGDDAVGFADPGTRSPGGVEVSLQRWSNGSCQVAIRSATGDVTHLGGLLFCERDESHRYLALTQASRDAKRALVWTSTILDVEDMHAAVLPASTCGGRLRWSAGRVIEMPDVEPPPRAEATPVCVFARDGALLARVDVKLPWRQVVGGERLDARVGLLPREPDVLFAVEPDEGARAGCRVHLLDLHDATRHRTIELAAAPTSCAGRAVDLRDATYAAPHVVLGGEHSRHDRE